MIKCKEFKKNISQNDKYILKYQLKWYIVLIKEINITMNGNLTIRQLRNLKSLTLEEASKLIGISREHLGRIETDFKSLRQVKLSTILKIVDIYETNINNIIFFEDNITQNGK